MDNSIPPPPSSIPQNEQPPITPGSSAPPSATTPLAQPPIVPPSSGVPYPAPLTPSFVSSGAPPYMPNTPNTPNTPRMPVAPSMPPPPPPPPPLVAPGQLMAPPVPVQHIYLQGPVSAQPPSPPPTFHASGKIELNTGNLSNAVSNAVSDLNRAGDAVGARVEATSKWALISVVCLVFTLFTGLTIIPAIIFGHMALREIKREPALKGRGMAIATLVIGYSLVGVAVLGILGTVAYLGLQFLLWYLKTQPSSGLIFPLSISG